METSEAKLEMLVLLMPNSDFLIILCYFFLNYKCFAVIK